MTNVKILDLYSEVNIKNVFDASKVVGGRHSGCIPFPKIPDFLI